MKADKALENTSSVCVKHILNLINNSSSLNKGHTATLLLIYYRVDSE